MSTEENTATHTRKAEVEADDQPETKKTKLSVEESEETPETPVKPKSKAGRPPVKKATPASASLPETDKQIVVASGSKDKKKPAPAPAPAPAAQKKKTAPADSDDDEETDGEQETKKKKKSSKSKPVREIIPHARLHSITGKIIEKNRPGLRIGDDFLVRLSEKLNHYVTDFIKASHLCSTFKGLKTTNGNAIALTGELISFVRRNPHLLFELKPTSEITYVSPNQKTRQPLMLTY